MSPAANRLRNALRLALSVLEDEDPRSFAWLEDMRGAMRESNRAYCELDDEMQATPTEIQLVRAVPDEALEQPPHDRVIEDALVTKRIRSPCTSGQD